MDSYSNQKQQFKVKKVLIDRFVSYKHAAFLLISPNLMKKQTHLHLGWPEGEHILILAELLL